MTRAAACWSTYHTDRALSSNNHAAPGYSYHTAKHTWIHGEDVMAGTGTYNPSQLSATVSAAPACPGTTRPRWWPRVLAAMPLRFALLATTAVWAMGCV